MHHTTTTAPTTIERLARLLTIYAKLSISQARMIVAERISLLLSTIAVTAIAIGLGLLALVFVSIGLGHLLAVTIAPVAAYLYVAAFYVIVAIVVIALRRRLIINPIARFVSKIILSSPTKQSL
ncbi:MAG: hypothetical protein ACI30K_02515 [Muribaculaceae bacterium]